MSISFVWSICVTMPNFVPSRSVKPLLRYSHFYILKMVADRYLDGFIICVFRPPTGSICWSLSQYKNTSYDTQVVNIGPQIQVGLDEYRQCWTELLLHFGDSDLDLGMVPWAHLSQPLNGISNGSAERDQQTDRHTDKQTDLVYAIPFVSIGQYHCDVS